MKKPSRWPVYLLLLVFSLALGGWLGFRIGNVGEIKQLPTPPGAIPEPARADQRSLLILGVDRVDSSEARLQGVWYAVYRQNSPHITLVPLFPALTDGDAARARELNEAFRLRSDGAVDPAFFKAVGEEFGMSWDAYVLLDDIAIMEIVDFFGGVPVNGEVLSGPRAVGGILRAWEDPVAAVLGQASLLENLCQGITFDSTPKNYEKITSLIPDHLRSELTMDQAFSAWLGLLSSGPALACEFPSLRATETPDG
jgi:hypothetical protein